jgi:hypothetical protein
MGDGMNPELLWIRAKCECEIFGNTKYIEYHMAYSDLIDDDGYPTDECLEIVKRWSYTQEFELFRFIEGLWEFHDFGWHVEEEKDMHKFFISTGGWSGNESLISALQGNWMIWHSTWEQSRRGGHYIFEIEKD